MPTEHSIHRSTPYHPHELDELQRGHEEPVTVETMEPARMPHTREQREVPVPHPGDRPGALRAGNGAAEPGERPIAAEQELPEDETQSPHAGGERARLDQR